MTVSLAENYALPSDEIERALAYPYDRPDGSFITNGHEITQLAGTYDGFLAAANNYLNERGLPDMSSRIAIVAYGANSNPIRFSEKMSAFQLGNRYELQVAPHLEAVIPNTVVAWHGKPSQAGSAFAELYKGEETTGQKSTIHAVFLTPLQIALLHATEGVTYHLAPVEVFAGDDRRSLQALAYVAGESKILLKDGKPVLVRRAAEAGNDNAMTAEEVVDFMLAHASTAAKTESARTLVRRQKRRSLDKKKVQQAAISDQLEREGLSKSFSFPATEYRARANLNWGAGAPLHLMEEVVSPLRPTPEQIKEALHGSVWFKRVLMRILPPLRTAELQNVRKRLDIAEAIRKRAHEELAERVASSIKQKSIAKN